MKPCRMMGVKASKGPREGRYTYLCLGKRGEHTAGDGAWHCCVANSGMGEGGRRMRLGGGREGGKWRARVGSVLDIQYTSLSLSLSSSCFHRPWGKGSLPPEQCQWKYSLLSLFTFFRNGSRITVTGGAKWNL